jgi:uncharacterized DUF497 family protein
VDSGWFEWDEGNEWHILVHGVEPFEVEGAVLDPEGFAVDAYDKPGERREALVGATGEGRIMLVVYTMRGGKVRPITSRDASETQKIQARKEVNTMSKKRKEINSWGEVPSFASEKEEQAWWDEHDISEELLGTFEPRSKMDHLPPPREKTIIRPPEAAISVRMERDLVNRLKALAGKKGIGYQTLLRQFVADRVYEEEKREGILK